jgi:hypothetical protein
MLEIQRLRTEKDEVIKGLSKRNIDATETVEAILAKDTEWRGKKTELEAISAELNRISKQVGEFFQQGKHAEANEAKAKTATLKTQEAELKAEVQIIDEAITQFMYQLPNVPNELVPSGKNELDNVYFTGFVPPEEMDFLYTNSCGVIFTSLVGPDAIPPLEAWKYKKPLISTCLLTIDSFSILSAPILEIRVIFPSSFCGLRISMIFINSSLDRKSTRLNSSHP